MEHLTLLNGLMISGCLNIWSLPTLARSVETFQVDDYDDEFMNSCQTFGDPNWEQIEHIPTKYIFDPARKENKIMSCIEHVLRFVAYAVVSFVMWLLICNIVLGAI